jgi:hypothetical protein
MTKDEIFKLNVLISKYIVVLRSGNIHASNKMIKILHSDKYYNNLKYRLEFCISNVNNKKHDSIDMNILIEFINSVEDKEIETQIELLKLKYNSYVFTPSEMQTNPKEI